MGQKVNAIGLRLGINKTWDSRWFAGKDYADLLHQDLAIRNYVHNTLTQAGISKVVIELFTEFSPKTCENFIKLCVGGHTNKEGKKLSYIGSEFHRVVKGMYIQGGDLSKHSGISKLYFNNINLHY